MSDVESRYFNRLEVISDGVIRKSSTDRDKIRAEYAWYSEAGRRRFPFLVPEIIEYGDGPDGAYYDMQYVRGATLAEHFIREDIDAGRFVGLLDRIVGKVCSYAGKSREDPSAVSAMGERLYRGKTLARLADAGIGLDRTYVPSGGSPVSVGGMVDGCRIDVLPSRTGFMHGDVCLCNLVMEGGTGDVYLVDPKGAVSEGCLEDPYAGDVLYDVAKLSHSVMGLYDLIKAGILRYAADGASLPAFVRTGGPSPYQRAIAREFEESVLPAYGIGREDVLGRMVHLFLSMIPLHRDRPDHQESMLGRAYDLYGMIGRK